MGRALVKYTHVLRTVNFTAVTGSCVFVGNLHRNTVIEHGHANGRPPVPSFASLKINFGAVSTFQTGSNVMAGRAPSSRRLLRFLL